MDAPKEQEAQTLWQQIESGMVLFLMLLRSAVLGQMWKGKGRLANKRGLEENVQE